MTPSFNIGKLVKHLPDIQDGKPFLDGTDVTVQKVVETCLGTWAPEQIPAEIGKLDLAQVHAALAYYYTNPGEFDIDEEGLRARRFSASRFFTKWFVSIPNSSRTLKKLERGPHVNNLIKALTEVGDLRDNPTFYDQQVHEAVLEFQKKHGHRNEDGDVGPGTRLLLAHELLKEKANDASYFYSLEPTYRQFYRAFISYAHSDDEWVTALYNWLQDHDIGVTKDAYYFRPGHDLKEEIESHMLDADKVIAVVTSNSKGRKWVDFEHALAQEIGQARANNFLVCVILDGADLPAFDEDPIRVDGSKLEPLDKIGKQLLLAIKEKPVLPT